MIYKSGEVRRQYEARLRSGFARVRCPETVTECGCHCSRPAGHVAGCRCQHLEPW